MCAGALGSANGGRGSCLKTVKNWALEEGENTFEFEYHAKEYGLEANRSHKKGRRRINIQSECLLGE